ncbi:UDP-N-acetylglucosamine 2-epimerase (non-hydrolyzing) [Mesorhizobium sp. BAC0120]|uniref:non-hydrolyzing UDP-N-acetylglucosamine 2-epimerase n=1 Tax=Mesorhizobium sp. BAC0120 TaxID=3090670 RepID=UPI00298BD3C1|nr:UDP-N-acetylglucosamine 2-epimerase (non-hydrolyzing) [Mesorhizobium sp. BAC0120]MDW6020972.1 UDP-N-acetylglucosamine 2-epimerase (non-hydrolyzing) [Mesorhizobium sp. BAC0120]
MNSSKLVDVIAGARPNFMKIAPIIRAIETLPEDQTRLRYRLVHTGQHYDPLMSGEFFKQLGIPEPHANLGVGSGTQAEQTAAIMVGYEKLLMSARSDVCLVVGDVTSTMACAITAQKLGVPVAHVEAGIRSGDWGMPEEINRMVTDSITNWFFTTSEVANENLRRSGVDDGRIFFVGNTMIDTLLSNEGRLRPPDFWHRLGLERGEYFVLTLHRPSNVDDLGAFRRLLDAIGRATRGMTAIFPVHPRTAKTISRLGDLPGSIQLVEPQPYLEFNYLVKYAKAVITDSGGVTEETTVMGVPCITLRSTTERPETVSIGTNELIGTDPDQLQPTLDRLFQGRWKHGRIPEKWDGRAAERIIAELSALVCGDKAGRRR